MTPSLDAPARLRAIRDRLSLLQLAIGVLAVALGGGVATSSLVAFSLAAAWAYRRPPPVAPTAASQRRWTLLVLLALVVTIVRTLQWAEFLDAGVDFLLLVAVQRLLHRHRTREHYQLLLLGALLMIVGAVINTELSYPALLVAYVAVVCSALVVDNLVAEGERLGPRAALEIARESLRRRATLSRAALGVAAMAAAGGIAVFLVFPRWGVGAFLRGAIARDATSGFSDEVRLGGFGTIKEDATVVMRIRPHGAGSVPERPTWHLRGSAFDVYEDGRWRQGRFAEAADVVPVWGFASLVDDDGPLVVRSDGGSRIPIAPRPIPGSSRSDQTLHATVTLDDIGTDAVFVASAPLAVRLVPRGPVEAQARLSPGRNQEFRLSKPPGPVQYDFVSRVGTPTRDELAAVGDPMIPPILVHYAQPAPGLSPEVGALARGLTEGASDRIERVEAVMAHLETFSYTLQQPSSARVADGADPIEGFLFDTRAGHCEYFATALAVLLREVGVPTRIVNGYYGAHENELGGYWTVRQADAHSWVEVHFGALGWVTFDPTPPSGRMAGDDAPLWPAAAELLDAVHNAYLEWVIDYDLGKQRRLLDGLAMRDSTPPIAWRSIAIGVVIAGVVLAAALLLRRRAAPLSPVVRIWMRVLARLSARGERPLPTESATAFARRLVAQGRPHADAFAEFAALYERLRFGRGGGDDEIAALARLGDRIR